MKSITLLCLVFCILVGCSAPAAYKNAAREQCLRDARKHPDPSEAHAQCWMKNTLDGRTYTEYERERQEE